jgi:hypothetical protein
MAYDLTSDHGHRGPSRGNENRLSLNGYRFGRISGMPRHGRAALSRAGRYLKTAIEAIANSKLRRMERELELRGISRDRTNDGWKP